MTLKEIVPDRPASQYARLTVVDGALTEYPIAQRTRGGWQNGVTFYPDEKITDVRELAIHPKPETERIDHVAAAMELAESAEGMISADWESQTGELKADQIALAQVHATLALVEQQRIANLIAIGAAGDKTPLKWAPREDIREGLGL